MTEAFHPSGGAEKPKEKPNLPLIASFIADHINSLENKLGELDAEREQKAHQEIYTYLEENYSLKLNANEKKKISKLVETILNRGRLKKQIDQDKVFKRKLEKLNLNEKNLPEIAKRIPDRITGSHVVRSARRISLARTAAEAEFSKNILFAILKALKRPIEGKHQFHVSYFELGIEPTYRMTGNKMEYSAKLTQKQKEELIRAYILSQKESGE